MQEDNLAQQAIQAAIKGEWQEAVNLNKRILTVNPNDLEAVLRLANAYCQIGKTKDAVAAYKKALKLDPHNLFAQRGLEKIKRAHSRNGNGLHKLENSFLEEPGKTKTINLVHTAQLSTILQLDSGQPVNLLASQHRISIETEDGTYIGRLPDDLALRLIGFIKGGNEYEAVIKSADLEKVAVFIREVVRAKRFETIPSFSPEANNFPEEEL